MLIVIIPIWVRHHFFCESYKYYHMPQLSDTLGLHAIRGRPWQIQKCSAKTGDGLQAGIEWVLANMKKH